MTNKRPSKGRATSPKKVSQIRAAERFVNEHEVAMDSETMEPAIWNERLRMWSSGKDHLKSEVARWVKDTLDSDIHSYSNSDVNGIAELVVCEAMQAMLWNPRVFDCNPNVMGLPDGGVVDLTTGKIRPAESTDCVTMKTLVVPEESDTPIWDSFLDDATQGNAEFKSSMLRCMGYTLAGNPREEKALLCKGTGGNGKGTMLRAILEVMGDYALGIQEDFFTRSAANRHRTELADLNRIRGIFVLDAKRGKWSSNRFNALTGNDGTIRANRMYCNAFDVNLMCVLWASVNHIPQMGNDDSIRRRLVVWPFNNSPKNENTKLKESLQSEYPGILYSLIQECVKWHNDGLLAIPQVSIDATEDCLEAGGRPLDSWWSEYIVKDPLAETPFEELYEHASQWWGEQGHPRTLTKHSLGIMLTNKGVRSKSVWDSSEGKTVKIRVGIRFMRPEDREDDQEVSTEPVAPQCQKPGMYDWPEQEAARQEVDDLPPYNDDCECSVSSFPDDGGRGGKVIQGSFPEYDESVFAPDVLEPESW